VGGDLLCVFFAVFALFATWREIICGKEGGSRKGAKSQKSAKRFTFASPLF
jgi:hypothetical protein